MRLGCTLPGEYSSGVIVVGDCGRMQKESRYIARGVVQQPGLLGSETAVMYRIRLQVIFVFLVLVAGLMGCQNHRDSLPPVSQPGIETPPVVAETEKGVGEKSIPEIEEDEEFPGYVRLSRAQKDAMLSSLSLGRQKMESWNDLRPSLERSLSYLRLKPADQTAIQSDDFTCSWGDLKTTVEDLIALLPELDAHPDRLRDTFEWYMLTPSTLMTGYYEPLIHASPAPCPEYPFPLYGRPTDLQVADLG
jgi:hypothetical protein